MKAYRAAILSFSGAGAEVQAHWQDDGLLVTGIKNQDPTREVILAVGDYQTVMNQWAARQLPPLRIEDIEHLPGKILAPGFVDMHSHFPQMDVIASPATGLLPWL